MRETVIVDAVRTAVGKRNGGLSGMHAADLSAVVLNELLERTGVGPEIVDDVVWGCVSQVGDQSANIGRYAVLAAGWPESIPGTTVNRACGSSQQALDFAVQAVMSGQQDVVVAGGVEVMSRVPLGAARATGMPYGPKVLARYGDFSFNQGLSAGRVQSPAVRLIVERERERIAFRSADYWDFDAAFPTDPAFTATLLAVDEKRVATGRDFDDLGRPNRQDVVVLDEPAVRELVRVTEGQTFTVRSTEEKPYTSRPKPPFITSTLQQEGGRKLRTGPSWVATSCEVSVRGSRRLMAAQLQNCLVASRAPSAIAAILAQTTSGSTAAWPTQVP